MNLKHFLDTAFEHLIYFNHYHPNDKTTKQSYFYFAYLLLFTGIAFLLGSLLNYGFKFDFVFIGTHALALVASLLAYWIILIFLFDKIIGYYAFDNDKTANRHLLIYASTPFFAGEILGNIISPDSYFFINFVFSFLSAYYFEMGLTKNNDFQTSIRLGISILLYVFLIFSYFFINTILVSLN